MSSVDETREAAGTRADDDPTTERARAIVASVLGCDVASLQPETSLFDDLEADEESLANVASMLEMELGIDELYEDVDYWETVGDVLDSVQEQTA